MHKNTFDHIDKTVYILLLIIAEASILVAMVAGPLGRDKLSIGASACACIIGVALIVHTLRAFISKR